MKTGVRRNSTAGGGEATENGWDISLDVMEGWRPIKLTCGVEQVLLASSCCRRRLAMYAINWASMGFFGA